MIKKNQLKAIDFFCGAGGMTYGMRQAGIDVLAGIDLDAKAKETYEYNNPGSVFLNKNIFEYQPEDLKLDIKELKGYDLKEYDDEMIFIGCSPCQYWSLVNRKKESSAHSKDLLKDFQRFVEAYKPGFVVIENVPGLEKKKEESGLQEFLDVLKKLGYKNVDDSYDIYNLNEYGVPQSRRRFSLIVSRVTEKLVKPDKSSEKPTAGDFIKNYAKFPPIEAGHKDENKNRFHSAAGLSAENIEALKKSKPCGKPAKKRKNFSEVGFQDSYGRMCWDKPAPTITTKFFSLSNGRFGHPEQNRALSIREGATLQTFPENYVFKTNSIQLAAKFIGNAVPPEFARRIGEAIIKSLEDGK